MKKNIPDKLKVVYLLGTGVTQAEANLTGSAINILMGGVREGILNKIEARKIRILFPIKNELTAEHADIEHLITLYESTGIHSHSNIARKLKALFKEDIQEKISQLPKDFKPRLLTALIDMHQIAGIQEELTGILTLNYDDLLEQAAQEVKGGINCSIDMNYQHSHLKHTACFPILKLHGSFNWENTFPIALKDDHIIKNAEDALWIPPGVEKNRDRYPFSILWGKAREILDCDILRVIGCSLSRNDWQLVSLLYITQQLRSARRVYLIDLIDYADRGGDIADDYTYLRFRNIVDIKAVRDYFIRSYSLDSKAEDKISKDIKDHLSNRRTNIFAYWLKAVGEDLLRRETDIATQNNIFKDYIREV
ncbi:MAG: SIR2 family protein [Dissulfurispiraceae bacterium]